MTSETKHNYGFIKPVIKPDQDYILGGFRSAPYEIVQPNGKWRDYLPQEEEQFNDYFNSYNCTAYNSLNPIETLFAKKYGLSINYSERALGIMAGTKPPGNSPDIVAEVIRKQGLVEEFYLPFFKDDKIKSVEEYYSPQPLTDNLINRAKRWTDEWTFNHEWVFLEGQTDIQNKIMEALKCSPVSVAVFAWEQNAEGFYYAKPEWPQNHWVAIYGYEEGHHWTVYDSERGGAIKELVWDFPFGYAKRYHIERKIKMTFWEGIKKHFNEILK